jgi:uracil-DNA glycosylase
MPTPRSHDRTRSLRSASAWTIGRGWDAALADELRQPYFRELKAFVAAERRRHTVYPQPSRTFAAFRATPLNKVRVVILGQDPYHRPGQADGMCFSVPPAAAFPPSLRNIFREAAEDLGRSFPPDGDLSRWARQGVLLLNSILTVRAGEPLSHRGLGWERLTDATISRVSRAAPFCAFLLWGSSAAAKRGLIDRRHAVLQAAHPSPLSAHRGFFGSRPFSQCNRALREHGQMPIDW